MNEVHHLPFVGDITGWESTIFGLAFIFAVQIDRVIRHLERIATLLHEIKGQRSGRGDF